MTDYHIDLAQTYDDTHANNGAAPGTPWGGPAGLIHAASVAAPLDTLIVANAADPDDNIALTTLWRISVASTTNMDAGDLLENQTRAGTARIAVVVADTFIMAELVSGSFVNGDTITPDGGTTTTTVAGVPAQPGLFIDDTFAADGTAVGFITVRGVASNWTTDQHAVLEGESTTTDGILIQNVHRWRFRYLEIQRPAGAGVSILSVTHTGLQFDHVRVDLAGTYGWKNLNYATAVILSHCTATHCSWSGISALAGDAIVEYSVITDNGSSGIGGAGSGSVIRHCLIADNATRGVVINNSGVKVIGNIIDGNGADGIEISGTNRCNLVILTNRITHNANCGIDAVGGYDVSYRGDYNVFYGNAWGSMSTFAGGDNDHGPVGDTSIPVAANRDVVADGYADRDAGDYALTAAATLRREQVAIDTSNAVYITAGLTPTDLSSPAVGDVQDGVGYSDGALTGTLELPAESDVAESVGYGEDGTEFIGTMGTTGTHDHTVRLTIHHAR